MSTFLRQDRKWEIEALHLVVDLGVLKRNYAARGGLIRALGVVKTLPKTETKKGVGGWWLIKKEAD